MKSPLASRAEGASAVPPRFNPTRDLAVAIRGRPGHPARGGLRSVPRIGGPRPLFAARSGVGSEAFCGAALHPVGGTRSRRISSYVPHHCDIARNCSMPGPGTQGRGGGGIAHIITHSMHHGAQLLYMLRRLGVQGLPEGDVLSWENQARRS